MPRILLVLCLVGAFSISAAGCSSVAPQPPEPERPTESQQYSEPPPELVVGGSAAENEKYFAYSLRKAIRGGMPINGVETVNAVVAAGFDKTLMQVSFDQTQTRLAADNIFVSVRVNEQCLIGQIITSDKTVATSVQPAIGPDKSLCLVGKTRPIDW